MYTDLVMDHFTNPRNVGEVDDADGSGQAGNPVCGDVTVITVKVEDDRVVDIKFKTFGCAAAVATSSMLTELVMGKTLTEAAHLTKAELAAAVGGLPEKKMHCSNIAPDALRAAIEDYLERHDRGDEAREVLG